MKASYRFGGWINSGRMIIFTNLCLSVSLLSSGILDCAPDMTVLSIFMLTHYIHCSEAVHVNVPWFEGLDLCCSEINCLCFQRLLWGITSSISPVTQRPMSGWKQREVLGVCSHANLALGSPLQQMLLFSLLHKSFFPSFFFSILLKPWGNAAVTLTSTSQACISIAPAYGLF